MGCASGLYTRNHPTLPWQMACTGAKKNASCMYSVAQIEATPPTGKYPSCGIGWGSSDQQGAWITLERQAQLVEITLCAGVIDRDLTSDKSTGPDLARLGYGPRPRARRRRFSRFDGIQAAGDEAGPGYLWNPDPCPV